MQFWERKIFHKWNSFPNDRLGQSLLNLTLTSVKDFYIIYDINNVNE